jgi:transcriptional regulator with XRE-family HTH domain
MSPEALPRPCGDKMEGKVPERTGEETRSARETLGYALLTLREKAEKSLSQLAEDTGYDRSYLNRLEHGQRLSKPTVMEDLDSYYRTGTLLSRLWAMARDDVIVDRYRLFVQYEATAVIMHKYTTVMPGLLQTEDFARVILSSAANNWTADQLEEQVAARLSRQDLLRKTPAPNVRIILDECVLRRRTDDPKIWSSQLAKLLEAGQWPSLVLQVLPFAAGVHDLMGGSLSLLWQADGTAVAYLEGSKSGQLMENLEEVAQYRLSYDWLRDAALTPSASLDFIKRVLEGS